MKCYLMTFLLLAVAAGSLPAADSDQTLLNRTGDYSIRPGDELDIKFFYNPELNERMTVRPDGRIALQLIPEVAVAGLTSATLARKLEEMYGEQLAEPRVSVLVRSFTAQRVFVDGEVRQPSMVQLTGSLTLAQAIAQAGGLKETANIKQILVLRHAGKPSRVALTYDLAALRKSRAPAEDPTLQPEDIVFVSASRITNVNLWVDHYLRRNIPISTGMFWNLF